MSIPSSYKIKSKKKKKRSPLGCLLISVIVLAFILGGTYFGFQNWYVSGTTSPLSDSTEIVEVEIPVGSSPADIGQILLDNGLISDLNIWNLYIRLNNLAPNLLADTYKLPQNLTMEEIADTLTRPQEQQVVWVTFPEGIRYSEMGDILKNYESQFDGTFTTNDFLRIAETPDNYDFNDPDIVEFLETYKPAGKSLEGFLYPNTYAFETEMDGQEVIEFILREFINQVSILDLDNGKYDFYEALTLASVVEAEALDVDRAEIASIFSNRLDINQALQSDATVNYVTGKSDRRPTYADLEIDSTYNTYKYPGLMPSPINNPRIDSIKESLNPIETDYYYFIHEPDGTPHFGRNYDEHLQNVNLYLDN